MLSKNRVENIGRKREIACYKQFLLFSQCFPQLYIFSASKCQNDALCGNGLKVLNSTLRRIVHISIICRRSTEHFTLYHTIPNCNEPEIEAFSKNIVGKEKILQCFPSFKTNVFFFSRCYFVVCK